MFIQDNIKIVNAECISYMQGLESESFDMILCDLPYGTTACKWDTVIPFDKLWEQYSRLIKPKGVIVLTASQPFTSALVMSNPKLFKYEWIWQKDAGSNFATTKYQPMKEHESILVFAKGTTNYYPIKQERIGSRKGKVTSTDRSCSKDSVYGYIKGKKTSVPELRNPSSIQKFNRERGLHPTQKPVALFEYLIKTYTKEGDKVLDNCLGSGTTARACFKTSRHCLGIEQDKGYYDIACNSIINLKEDYESSSN